MIVHDSTGQIYELVAGHGEEAGGEEGADNSTARNGSRAVAALSDGGRNALGQPNAVIRIARVSAGRMESAAINTPGMYRDIHSWKWPHGQVPKP